MTDENVVVGEVVTGRRIETEVVVHFVHGPELTGDAVAILVSEALADVQQVVGIFLERSEEIVDRQRVTVRRRPPVAGLGGKRREIRSYIDLLEALPWVTGLGGTMVVSQDRNGPVEAAILTVNGYVHIRPPYRVTIRHTSDVDSGRPIPAGFLVEPS